MSGRMKGRVRGHVRMNEQKGIWGALGVDRGGCLVSGTIVRLVNRLVFMTFLLLMMVLDLGGREGGVNTILLW